jgi:arabinan endo-1,5-alpha-L-arabinosidase
LFTTGPGVTFHTSEDRVTWRRRGRVFERGLKWAADEIPGSRDYYWAPDISFFGGKWHLYYSVSTFGRNRSAIGLATNVTLDPGHPDFRWEDRGPVVESTPDDDWNAIDPNIALDEGGQPWLAFGSFWDGIKLLKIDPSTGKPSEGRPRLHSLARRPRTGGGQGAVEAPFVIRRGGFYYLFMSFDFCCRGVDSTYNIRVGRCAEITGPYLDRDGKPLLDGGGTLVRAGSGRWRGPGHNAVYREGDTDWLVYHAYDADERGVPKLRIEELRWDDTGWPRVLE